MGSDDHKLKKKKKAKKRKREQSQSPVYSSSRVSEISASGPSVQSGSASSRKESVIGSKSSVKTNLTPEVLSDPDSLDTGTYSTNCDPERRKQKREKRKQRTRELLADASPSAIKSSQTSPKFKCSETISQVDKALEAQKNNSSKTDDVSSDDSILTSGDENIELLLSQSSNLKKGAKKSGKVRSMSMRPEFAVYPSTNFCCPFVTDPKFRPRACHLPLNFEGKQNWIPYPDFRVKRYKGNINPRVYFDENYYLETRKVMLTCSGGVSLSSGQGNANEESIDNEEGMESEEELEIGDALSDDEDEVMGEIDLSNEDHGRMFRNVDLMGLYCERVTPLRAFIEETEMGGSFPLDQENSGAHKNTTVTANKIWALIQHQKFKNPEHVLELAKVLCGKVHDGLKRCDDTQTLFSLLLSHISYEKNHSKAFKLLKVFEDRFCFGLPCPENVRYEKARYLLDNHIYDKELIQSLNERYKSFKINPCYANNERYFSERKMWTTKLHSIVGTLLYKAVLNQKQTKSLSWHDNEFSSDFGGSQNLFDISPDLFDVELATQMFAKFFSEVKKDPLTLSDIGSCTDLLIYYADLKCAQGSRQEAVEKINRLIEKFPDEFYSMWKLADDIENRQTILVPDDPMCSINWQNG